MQTTSITCARLEDLLYPRIEKGSDRFEKIDKLFHNGIKNHYIKLVGSAKERLSAAYHINQLTPAKYLREFKFRSEGLSSAVSILDGQELTGISIEGEGCFIKIGFIFHRMPFAKCILNKIQGEKFVISSEHKLEFFSNQEVIDGLGASSDSSMQIFFDMKALSEAHFAIFAALWNNIKLWRCSITTPAREISTPLGILQHFYSLASISESQLKQILPLVLPTELKNIIVNYLTFANDISKFLDIEKAITHDYIEINQCNYFISKTSTIPLSIELFFIWLRLKCNKGYLSINGKPLEPNRQFCPPLDSRRNFFPEKDLPTYKLSNYCQNILITDDEWSTVKKDKGFTDTICVFDSYCTNEGAPTCDRLSPDRISRLSTPQGVYSFIGKNVEGLLFVYPKEDEEI